MSTPDQFLYDFIRYGTNADRLAFTPNPPGNNLLYIWFESDTGDTYAYDGSWNQINTGSAGINQLTGDVTAGPGSGSQAATLANTAVTPGSYTNTDLTVDSKGRITAAANGSSGGSGITQLTGDVTAGPGSGSQAATIPNGTVTYAKIQDVSATSRILGRKSSGSGDVEECTLSEILDFISSAAQGDILYRGSANWARLGAGTSGQFLKTQGTGANPIWATPSSAPVAPLRWTWNGAGSVLVPESAPAQGCMPGGTINRFRLYGDASGTATVDIWKTTFGASLPTVSNTIFGGGSTKPNLSSSQTYETTTMTGVTTSITAGDVLVANLDSSPTPASITKLVLEVWYQP